MADDAVTQDGAGAPDQLERLWTPYRMAYIRGEERPRSEDAEQCPFCRIPGLPDEEGLVVHRGDTAYVVLNLFPYAAGHLMVCPYRHIPDYTDTSVQEAAEIAALTKRAMTVLRSVSNAEGFNLGMNQGQAGGAGIRRPPPPARRPPLAGRRQLHADHRPDQDHAAAAGGDPPAAGRRLGLTPEIGCVPTTRE